MLFNQWQPWTELNRLSREMDRMFGERGAGSHPFGVETYPALNIWEDEDNLYVESELPGLRLDDLEIYVTGNQLTIHGERRPPEHDGGQWHCQERAYGKFSRSIELPGEFNGDAVSAEFKQGVLLITLPKSEAVKPRRVEVRSS